MTTFRITATFLSTVVIGSLLLTTPLPPTLILWAAFLAPWVLPCLHTFWASTHPPRDDCSNHSTH
jgi:hypothetical protein